MSDETRMSHQQFGAALFNKAWELIEKVDRTDDEAVAMLLAAATSRWHWGEIGGAEQLAVGDWQVAHVASLLGLGDLARLFSERSLSLATLEGWEGWRLASAHEGMARACTASGDAEGREHHIARAREALDGEADAENRGLIADQLASIPAIARTPGS